GKTGLTPTVTICKEGGSFASPAGAVSEIGNGWYKVAGNATDTNTLGTLLLHAEASGADPVDMEFEVVAFDPLDSVRAGLTALPNAAADAAGGLPISDAGGLDLDAKIGALTFTVAGHVDVNVQTWGGTPISTPPSVNATQISGDSTAADTLELFAEALDQSTGQLDAGSFANGAITSSTFASGAITATVIASDAAGADEISTAAANKVADVVLRCGLSDVEGSSLGGTLSGSSIYGLIQEALESAISGSTLTVKKTDGSTTRGTKSVATSASAEPVTGVS